MIPYYILCIVPIVVCAIERRDYVIRTKSSIRDLNGAGSLTFFLIFIVMLSLRNVECGVDLKNYLYYFNRYSKMNFTDIISTNWTYDVELGFRLFNFVLSKITDNFQCYLGIVACISLFPYCILYKKEASHSILVIALYLTLAPFSLYFSGIRQGLAMALSVPALYYVKNKKILSYILIVFAASTVHFSAIVLFLLYPIFHARINKNWLYIVVPLMGGGFVFRSVIFSKMMAFLRGTQYEAYSLSATGAYGILFLMVIFSVFIIVITRNVEDKLTQEDIGYRNLLLLSTFLQFFATLSTIAMRMNYYYLAFIPIVIVRLISKSDPKYRSITNMAIIVMTVFFFTYFIRNMYVGADILQIYPYKPFWN